MRPDKSTLALAIAACGLSQREAADYLGVRRDTIGKALIGRGSVPAGWLRELRDLHERQQQAADQVMESIPEDHDGIVEIGIASDDAEAQAPPLGWPCVGAQMAVARLLWEAGLDVVTVPRGATMVSAAAADRHESAA